MIYRFRLFGHEIASLELEDSYEDAPSAVSGGAGGVFERDPEPMSPDDRWDWTESEDRRFGFR